MVGIVGLSLCVRGIFCRDGLVERLGMESVLQYARDVVDEMLP